MSISNKPLLWLPFAGGGMLAALLLPVLMLVLLLDSLGMLPTAALAHERVGAWLSQPLVVIGAFVFIALVIWHAAHRLRMTLQDLGVRSAAARRLSAGLCYSAAGLATLALVWVWV
jgi:fumarate reductase subunit D